MSGAYTFGTSPKTPGFTRIADGPNLDAFSRVRVSTPIGLFDSTFQYDLQPFVFYQTVANGGAIAHAAATSSATLSTDAQSSSSAVLQSKAYHRYIPAKSQLIVMTQVLGAAVSGVTKRAGYFDASDGIFVEQTTTGVRVVRRTSTSGAPVDNLVEQADWNLDKLDGTGSSRLTLDLSKASIFVVDLQWLGMGRVRVGFDIGGQLIYCHEFLNANVLSVPYMKTANLPVRWEIAGNAVATLSANCSAVISEGGVEADRGYLFAHATASITAGDATRTAIMAIRPAATFNSIVNRIQIQMETFNGLNLGLNPVLWEVVYNPTVTGGAWVSEGTNSSVEYNITPTGISGGEDTQNWYGPATASTVGSSGFEASFTRLPLTLDPAGANPITIALCARGIGGTSAVRAAIAWRELR